MQRSYDRLDIPSSLLSVPHFEVAKYLCLVMSLTELGMWDVGDLAYQNLVKP